MDRLKEVFDATMSINGHVQAIKELAAGVTGSANQYALIMTAAHQILELPADDLLAYQALEKVYFHFHKMEGLNNGKSEH